jgi:hypothetical protein
VVVEFKGTTDERRLTLIRQTDITTKQQRKMRAWFDEAEPVATIAKSNARVGDVKLVRRAQHAVPLRSRICTTRLNLSDSARDTSSGAGDGSLAV